VAPDITSGFLEVRSRCSRFVLLYLPLLLFFIVILLLSFLVYYALFCCLYCSFASLKFVSFIHIHIT
jgi:hypothetical protein